MENAIYINNTKKTAFYCRTAVENEESILQQQEQLVEYAKQNAITEYDFYVDNGFSGTTLNRPALKQIFLDSTTGVLG